MAKRKREGATASEDEYVGYGCPPKEHRFKEGKVANPWGRRGKPKPKSDFLDERQRIRIDGRWRWVTRDEALDHALYRVALSGNVSAVKLLQHRRTVRAGTAESLEPGPLSLEDEAALVRYARRLEREGTREADGTEAHDHRRDKAADD